MASRIGTFLCARIKPAQFLSSTHLPNQCGIVVTSCETTIPVSHSFRDHGLGQCEVNPGFSQQQTRDDLLIQVGVREEADFHERVGNRRHALPHTPSDLIRPAEESKECFEAH
jgi:hypothetical protein